MFMLRSRPYEVTLSWMISWRASAFATVTATPALGQALDILVIVYHNAFPSLIFMSIDRLSNGSIDEEIDTAALGAILAALDAAATIFAVFVDAAVIAVAMVSVMVAMKGCMMPVNVAVES